MSPLRQDNFTQQAFYYYKYGTLFPLLLVVVAEEAMGRRAEGSGDLEGLGVGPGHAGGRAAIHPSIHGRTVGHLGFAGG